MLTAGKKKEAGYITVAYANYISTMIITYFFIGRAYTNLFIYNYE